MGTPTRQEPNSALLQKKQRPCQLNACQRPASSGRSSIPRGEGPDLFVAALVNGFQHERIPRTPPLDDRQPGGYGPNFRIRNPQDPGLVGLTTSARITRII